MGLGLFGDPLKNDIKILDVTMGLVKAYTKPLIFHFEVKRTLAYSLWP